MELVNQEAESLVLAAMLRYPEDYWSINSVGLVPQDFIGTNNRKVMKAIASVVADKKTPDLPFIMEELRMGGDDTEYVLRLNELPCSVPQAHEYARTVKGLSASRSLADAGAKIIEVARENRSDYESAISNAETLLAKVKRVLPPDERSPEPGDILARMRTAGPTVSVPLRFAPTLQSISGGLAPGHFWVIGGFSSVGKTAFAINMALDVIYHRRWVGLFSLEMTSEQYMMRMLSAVSGVPQNQLRDKISLPFDQHETLDRVSNQLGRAPLRIYDTAWKLEQIKSKATRMKETTGLDVMFVDFIQNIHVTGDEFSDARTVALELQRLAKDLSCTVIAFSQVSNEMAKRDADGGDKNYYSFKGHGAIRDAADLAIMLRRDRIGQSPYLSVSVVKNRHGELADITCQMELETGMIQEIVAPMERDDA